MRLPELARFASPSLLALFLCASPVAAQAPSAATQETTPTFRASTRLVVVDVVATERDGKPLTGLKKEDFELSEDGKPQSLSVFEPHVPAVQPAAVPDLHLGANEYTNFPKLAANSSIN